MRLAGRVGHNNPVFSDHLCIEASGGATAGENCAIVYNFGPQARQLKERKAGEESQSFSQHPFLPCSL